MVCFFVFSCFLPLPPGIRPVYVEVFASLMNCVYVSKKIYEMKIIFLKMHATSK